MGAAAPAASLQVRTKTIIQISLPKATPHSSLVSSATSISGARQLSGHNGPFRRRRRLPPPSPYLASAMWLTCGRGGGRGGNFRAYQGFWVAKRAQRDAMAASGRAVVRVVAHASARGGEGSPLGIWRRRDMAVLHAAARDNAYLSCLGLPSPPAGRTRPIKSGQGGRWYAAAT